MPLGFGGTDANVKFKTIASGALKEVKPAASSITCNKVSSVINQTMSYIHNSRAGLG